MNVGPFSYRRFSTPFGDILATASPDGITKIEPCSFENSPCLTSEAPHAIPKTDRSSSSLRDSSEWASFAHQGPRTSQEALAAFETWLEIYFSASRSLPVVPLMATGSTFALLVWEEIARIPYGNVRTYGDIARSVAKKLGKDCMSAQAVGTAVGKNPLPLIIPCHRVIRSDKTMGEFAWGAPYKFNLLRHEGVDVHTWTDPEGISCLWHAPENQP